MSFIGIASLQPCLQICGIHLPLMLRQSKDLVPAEFNGSCLMDCNMSCLHSKNALISLQQTVDDSTVGLRPSNEEKDVGVRAAYGFADAGFGRCAEGIFPITGLLLEIGLGQALKDFGVRAFGIITSKGIHSACKNSK